ncbi:hypothetical protein EDB87DRAFT_829177 [Lactarius vividus]|nr:hypothetical protein EDB87DRAFT_829177 [Lactarius vividus]
MIGKLSDKALLEIFRYYLHASPRLWPRLVQACRRWRRIVFASQRALNLRLFCTHGTPVSKILDCWPTLPIVVNFGGSPALGLPAPEDEDHIMAALRQSDRVCSISLTVTSSLLEQFSVIEGPFSKLEDVVLLSRDSVQPTLPNTFRWGPRLRRLHLTGIAFPVLPLLLYSSRNLVDLRLHEVLNVWHVSPSILATALSGMAQLQSLSLHFLSAADHITFPFPSGKRAILPALTRLDLRGTNAYLESLVAGIDAPGLGDISITFFDMYILDISKLREFIDRIDIHRSHCRADILSSEHTISISLTQPGVPTCLKLQVLCNTTHSRSLFISLICRHFSTFLSRVEDLRISTARLSSRQDDGNREQWLGLIRRFRGAKWFHVTGDDPTNVMGALQLSDERRETVLPALHKICIREPEPRYAPLREAVVPFMHSCRLSGRFIAVEFERPCINEVRGAGSLSHKAAIEVLFDDILLNMFLHFLDGSSQDWPTLVHVSQRWRQIIFTSPVGLDLRLHCTYGTPVLKTINCWPSFPLVVNYGGSPILDPPSPEDEEIVNIMAALKQSDRVSSISLTVTSSLLEQLSTIPEPFSKLEKLNLLSRDNMQLTLPSAFRWGPRLRSLHSTRVAFPSFLQLLSLSRDIVDLRLHEIPRVGYFSPEAFANALSGMTQLRKLLLHFLSLPPRRNYLSLPPSPRERVILPALTCLKYRGTSKYLDSLVARIDAPGLGDIDITFFSQPTMDALQLGRFIDRIGIQKPNRRAKIRISNRAISICFTQPGAPTRVELRISGEQLDWQLSSMAQICDQFSAFLLRVEDLDIETTKQATGEDVMDGGQWLELVRLFGGAKDFRVAGELATAILRALCQADGEHTVILPVLRDLCVPDLGPAYGPLWEAASSFIASRWPSGSSVHVSPPSTILPALSRDSGTLLGAAPRQYFCTFCSSRFAERQSLSQHNEDNHMPVSDRVKDESRTAGGKGPETGRKVISNLDVIRLGVNHADLLTSKWSPTRWGI